MLGAVVGAAGAARALVAERHTGADLKDRRPCGVNATSSVQSGLTTPKSHDTQAQQACRGRVCPPSS